MSHIARGLTRIQRLSLQNCDQVSTRGIQMLLQLRNTLSALNLQNLNNISDDVFNYSCQLQWLNLAFTPISDRGLENLGRYVHELRDLNLSRSNATDQGLEHILRNCRQLQRLNLSQCHKITNKALQTLATFHSSIIPRMDTELASATLKRQKFSAEIHPAFLFLSVSGCYSVTDVGLSVLVKLSGFQQLEELDLSMCDGITNMTLSELAKYNFSRFSLLKLSGCSRLTDDGIKLLFQQPMKYLTRLEIAKCFRLTDVSIQAIVGEFD